MAAPFHMAGPAATVCAQICTHRNGLPQGAPTSPILSNYIASQLDRRLSRIARENGLRYSRFADDITFSTSRAQFPTSVLRVLDGPAATGKALTRVAVGEAVTTAITSCGFAINPRKVRLQTRAVRQSVTGLTVNETPNVERSRVRRVRAMIHAWRKHGAEAAGREHFHRYATSKKALPPEVAARAFRNALYGELAYLKMVRGADNPLFLRFCGQLLELDPNPSKFLRQMVFGADDFDVFISHASEDKESVARPIFEACGRAGIKAFLDEAHIGWGENYTTRINTALGAARTVIVIISADSVSKPWPTAEINTALSLEVEGHKAVLPVVVGRPDLSRLPLLRAKNHVGWREDPAPVIGALRKLIGREDPEAEAAGPRRRWFGLGDIFKR
jgi:RNA-directed DNA polymerase